MTSHPGSPEVLLRATRLLGEHARIAGDLEDLVNRAESGHWRLCDVVWDGVSRRLEDHMAFEEVELFSEFASSSVDAHALAATLRTEHESFRVALISLGNAVQLHTLREGPVRKLMDLLRVHAERENQTVYPWAVATHTLRSSAQGIRGPITRPR